MVHVLFSYAGKQFIQYLLQPSPADAIILFPGWPGTPSFRSMYFLYEQGFHVFVVSYQGLFQSEGVFLASDPVVDQQAVVSCMKQGCLDNLYTNKKSFFSVKKLFFLGSSFGGSIALGSAAHYSPDGLLLFAPVWDWSSQPVLDEEELFARRAFRHVYRLPDTPIRDVLCSYSSLRPSSYMKSISCSVLVFHDPQDEIVAFSQSLKYSQELGASLQSHTFGHGSSEALEAYWSTILPFFSLNR